MKTTRLVLAGIFGFSVLVSNAQVTQAVNAISASSYVGTSNNFDVVFKRQAVAAGLLSATSTSFGVNSKSMDNSVSIGVNAGQFSSGAGSNTYIGNNAGKGVSVSNLNSGSSNTFIGFNAGASSISGSGNIFIGSDTGRNNEGSGNIFIGSSAGYEDGGGGASGSIFIGRLAGYTESGDNRLVIGNGEDDKLIWGDFALDQLKFNAKVGIGYGFGNYPTTAGGVNVSTYNLFVKGGILTEEVRVSLGTTWADYVFAKDYELPTLAQVEKHIAEKGHLINVPSAAQVKEEGIALGEMSKIQQEKIEELTLYLIEQNKINNKQGKEIAELKALVLQMAAKK